MARYQYAGPGPDESSGELIRPGDVREFDQEPDWGPWELLDGPEAADVQVTDVPETRTSVPPAEMPSVTAPAPFLAAPITPKGM